MKRKIAAVVLVGLLSFVTMASTGCAAERASYFTEEEHLARVTERIEKKYMTEDSQFTSFAVYPLYNEKDKLQYCLVEFEPYDYIVIGIWDKNEPLKQLFSSGGSMYKIGYLQQPWSRYTIDATNNQPKPDTNKCYERDENGEIIEYNKSPYAVAGVQDTQRYLWKIEDEEGEKSYIPVVRVEEDYINLISMRAIKMENGGFTEVQATMWLTFYAKNYLK